MSKKNYLNYKKNKMTHSNEYAEELKKLHSKKSFGVSKNIPKEVRLLIEKHKVQSILDFGCGKGLTLQEFINSYPDIQCIGFDPGREGFDTLPDSVDLIYSSDVLEHIEPELLDATLTDLFSRCNKAMYHLIACHPAKKALSDGRNAHLIIESPKWWKKKLTSLGWNIVEDRIIEYTSEVKKGPPREIVKYLVIIEK